ncbi:MAG: hypothetical protein WAV13_05725 [Thermodesulfovibrionales bacterium]
MKVKELSRKLLDNGFNIRISTLGLSMFPLINTGDKIIISPGKDIALGAPIVFIKGDKMVCHRLESVFEKCGVKYFQTRGDSFFCLDEPITADQILGTVIWIERDNVSLSRRLLLFIYPVLRFGRLNAHVTSALIKIRSNLFSAV